MKNRALARIWSLALASWLVMLTAQARAQDGGPEDAAAELVPADARTGQIHDLMQGSLELTVDPQSLFDAPLADSPALALEAARIRLVLAAVDAPSTAKPGRPAPRRGQPEAIPAPGDAAVLETGSWDARVALDRARLAFYSLSSERRAELLQTHERRRAEAAATETDEQRLAREAEAERESALQAAHAARSEAERLVSEELARLIAVEERVVRMRALLRAARDDLGARRDTVLGWQRKARTAKSAASPGADLLYDALRRVLRKSRDDLSQALDELAVGASHVPSIGADALADIPPEIPTDLVRARRRAVEQQILLAADEERALAKVRASELLDEIDILNRERLGLLDYLSSSKRAAVTGFSRAGLDQARSEARHLQLILRYHLRASLDWLRSIRAGGPSGLSTWRIVTVGTPWLLLLAAFLWLRPKLPSALAAVEQRIAEGDRAERRPRPSVARRVVRFLAKTHRPLAWLLLFFFFAMWLAPHDAQQLIEVQLLASIVGWIFGGALVVDAINAVAAGTSIGALHDQSGTGQLRLRSLRLVGRTVVALALVLVISSRLVGEGTVYHWVLSTWWVAALPVFLILVRWWRETVFERIGRARKKTQVQLWVLANRTGWKSFLAAMLGAVQLFALGAIKTVRSWLSEFDLARRAHAYLFKRELERLGEGATPPSLRSLSGEVLASLSPDTASGALVESPASELLVQIEKRVAASRGGLLAVVGGRGMGKTTLLRSLAETLPDARYVDCSATATLTDLKQALCMAEGAWSTPERAPALVLLDDAQSLIKPVIGGLETFDTLISLARLACHTTTWVFSIDVAMWPYLTRARDARPLFDQALRLAPWSEEQIHALLQARCRQAGVLLTYEDLLDRLPAGADEVDRMDALKAREVGYVRMLWDHVRGNPGLALESWRGSLAQDERGVIHVRPLQVPGAAELELLPDSALFIVRAILLLAPAQISDVARATRCSEEQVLDTCRFGQMHGYFEESQGRIRITWRWLRPILRLLERRHLLVDS